MSYWLFKTEPDAFSIDDLKKRGTQGEIWDGVRNYQARNMLRDQVKVDDRVFIYHSNCETPGVVGIARVVEAGVVDPMQFNPESKYYDPGAKMDAPRWITVRVVYEKHLPKTATLAAIKAHPGLQDMQLVKRGNRLSILPVSDEQWDVILNIVE
jgi:predicted RNA-binding protein with PUA-like domain